MTTEAETKKAFCEYLGGLSADHTTEMLTHLTNTNNFANSIPAAWQKALTVDLYKDEQGRFVGLLLTPDESEYRTDVQITPTA